MGRAKVSRSLLRFHARAAAFLGAEDLDRDPDLAQRVRSLEGELGARVPAAVEEWITVRGFSRVFPSVGRAVPLDRIATMRPHRQGSVLVDVGLLPILRESQDNGVFAVALDGGDDPAVICSDQEGHWLRCCETFSDFALAMAFDMRVFDRCLAVALDQPPMSRGDLAPLEAIGDGFPVSCADLGEERVRISLPEGLVLVSLFPEQTDCWLGGDPGAASRLIAKVGGPLPGLRFQPAR